MSLDVEKDESTPVIVDCDVLEAAKENIQPLAKGRRVTALSAILSTPHAQRETRLAATRNRLRMNVDLALENSRLDEAEEDGTDVEDSDADPLEAYCQFVNWVVENYPQGHSAESGLLELLEEATRVLKDHQGGKWRDDIRYLKLWVLYASYVEKPAIIYKFCMVNEIGTSHALLYEEFAIALERANRKTQADETYRIGIARKAAPVERLETKYREFQKRMMASPKLASVEDSSESTTPSSVPATTTRRKALGEAGPSRSSTRSTRASSRTASTPSTTPTIPQTTTRSQSNARLQVFVDPSPDAAAPPETILEEEATPWTDLGTRKSRVKENIKEATKAAGTTLRQPGRAHRTAPSQGSSKISVYRDPEPAMTENTSHDNENSPEPQADPTPPPKAKAGRSIAVFRNDEPEAAPAPKKAKSSAKSSIPVFRDESAGSSSKPSRSKATAQSSIPVFRDEPAPPAAGTSRLPKSKAQSKSTIGVFRDEEPGAGNETRTRSTKAKSSIAVFRDEPAAEASSSTKPAKAKLAVFRDPDAAEAELSTASEAKKTLGKIAVFHDAPEVSESAVPATKAKGKIAVFRDEPADMAPEKAKSKIAVFRDEEPPRSFTPYQDDEAPKSPTIGSTPLGRTKSGSGVGLGIAGLGPAGAKMSSEAEALRKDPLKNYAEDQKVLDLD